MKTRFGLVAMAVLVFAAGCSGASNKGARSGLGPATTIATGQNAVCKNAKLTSPEIGVSDKTITITVAADVQNVARPGLFQGSWDGVKAWGDYINSRGGLACRQVVVKTADTHLSGDAAKAVITEACGNSLATVGTTALFLADVRPMNACKDKAGAATGLPDIALVQTEAVQQCSPVSFAALPIGVSCPYSGSGPRTYSVIPTQPDYYAAKYGTGLHGVMVVPKDTPATISSAVPVFRGFNLMGIKSDAEFGVSGLADQPAYSRVAVAIKQHDSNFASNLLDFTGMVLERKEAAAQGVNNQVKVWDCQLNCYDKRLITEGGSAVERTYAWLSFLPMEDKGTNAELDSFLQYDKNPDGWGMQAWLAGEIFGRAVNDAMAAHNNDPNAITRANVLAALRNLHDFDANGMMPKTDVGGKKRTGCLVAMQVQNGKFVRVDPPQPGTFDCDNNKPLPTMTIDPVKEYKG